MARGRILYSYSQAGQADAIRSMLKPLPVQFDMVHGIREALSILRQKRFHAIIATLGDGSAPDGDEGLLCLLKEHKDKTPVIVVAEQADARVAERFHAAGAFDFMMMPADCHAFAGVVSRALLRSGLIFPQETAWPAPDQPAREFPFLIGRSEPMQEVLRRIAKAAEADANVCIFGETGTGKELVARAIHSSSRRSNRPMMVFDCTAVPEGLMESEMFGHVKGSFTSAVADRDGMFQLANGGSLLFDEIGELGLPLQAKLLRVIQTREFRRWGGKSRSRWTFASSPPRTGTLRKWPRLGHSARISSTASMYFPSKCRQCASVKKTFRFSSSTSWRNSIATTKSRSMACTQRPWGLFFAIIGPETSASWKTALSGRP